jgi:GntR family transcriptional regulator
MYKKVYQEVKEKIDMGAYSAGELLPTELELGKQFGVSRTTIRRAIDLLARDGYLQAKQGYGTEVLDYKTKQSLNAVTSISETLRKKGVHVRSKSIYIDTFDAPPQLADKLQIPTGTLLTRVQRIQLGDEKPIAIMQNYLVSDTVPDLQLFTKSTNSFYLYLEDKYGIIIDKAHDRITARAATFVEAEMLQIPIGTALIVFDRICYQQEKPVCVDHLKIVGDRYEFELTLTGRNAYGK